MQSLENGPKNVILKSNVFGDEGPQAGDRGVAKYFELTLDGRMFFDVTFPEFPGRSFEVFSTDLSFEE